MEVWAVGTKAVEASAVASVVTVAFGSANPGAVKARMTAIAHALITAIQNWRLCCLLPVGDFSVERKDHDDVGRRADMGINLLCRAAAELREGERSERRGLSVACNRQTDAHPFKNTQ